MKSNLVFCSLLSASFLFVSCKKEEEAVTSSSDKPKEIIMPRVQAIPAQTSAQQPVQNVQVQPQQPVTVSQPVAAPPPPVATKPGMNPPHGQPGHRCDIAVGMPLSTPKAKPAAPGQAVVQQINPATMTPQVQTSQPAAGATPAILDPNAPVTAPGMNPPHGQPGHQCGIAVGAPLPK